MPLDTKCFSNAAVCSCYDPTTTPYHQRCKVITMNLLESGTPSRQVKFQDMECLQRHSIDVLCGCKASSPMYVVLLQVSFQGGL